MPMGESRVHVFTVGFFVLFRVFLELQQTLQTGFVAVRKEFRDIELMDMHLFNKGSSPRQGPWWVVSRVKIDEAAINMLCRESLSKVAYGSAENMSTAIYLPVILICVVCRQGGCLLMYSCNGRIRVRRENVSERPKVFWSSAFCGFNVGLRQSYRTVRLSPWR